MILQVATVLLGVCVAAVAVLYAAPRGYLGHPRKKGSGANAVPAEMALAQSDQKVARSTEVWPVEAEPEPAKSASPGLYETVQPEVSPAPAAHAPPAVASFGASPVSVKPTRTYRRRTAPVRSTSASRAPRSARTKKR